MSEVKKKIIINHEHLNPNAQKRNKNSSNGSNGSTSGGRGRTLKKMPGFVRPSELKNNLIKLLKQKREEKQRQMQQKEDEQKKDKQKENDSSELLTNIMKNEKPMFDKKKYETIFSKDFEESLNYLKSFKQNNHHHSTTRKQKYGSLSDSNENSSVAMLDVPTDFTSPISLEMPSFVSSHPAPIKDISTTLSELQQQLQQLQKQQQQQEGGGQIQMQELQQQQGTNVTNIELVQPPMSPPPPPPPLPPPPPPPPPHRLHHRLRLHVLRQSMKNLGEKMNMTKI